MDIRARRSFRPWLSLGLFALLAAAPAAVAEDGSPTRAEYAAKVEPICKTSTQTNSRILKGIKGQVNSGRLVPAGKRFIRASNALGRSTTRIAGVPRPSADAARLTKWVRHLREQQTFLRKIGQALKAKNRPRASREAVKLQRANRQANNTVISFSFKHCRIESSRFL
jgi:hypothetical protein